MAVSWGDLKSEPCIRVLVVDDGRNFRNAAMAFLATQPHVEVVGAVESGPQAIEAAGHVRPDVILMDLRMAEMTGLKATRMIKKLYPSIKVVVVTLYDREWHQAAAREAGADGFINKASFTETCPALLARFVAEKASSQQM